MISTHPAGAIVEVWVVPGASGDEMVGEHNGALKVRVSAPAEGGKANRAVVRLLGLALPGYRISVVAGAGTRRKRLLVEGAAPATVRSLLVGSAASEI